MKILHILRTPDRPSAGADLVLSSKPSPGNEVALLLIHSAVLGVPSWKGRVYARAADIRARAVDLSAESGIHLVEDRGIVELVFDHDRVVVW